MIIKRQFEKGLTGLPGVDTRYFGKDAENFLESINWHTEIDYLGKECTADGDKTGIIIGFEDSESYMDYYFIIFIIETEEVVYQLANSSSFIKSIKI